MDRFDFVPAILSFLEPFKAARTICLRAEDMSNVHWKLRLALVPSILSRHSHLEYLSCVFGNFFRPLALEPLAYKRAQDILKESPTSLKRLSIRFPSNGLGLDKVQAAPFCFELHDLFVIVGNKLEHLTLELSGPLQTGMQNAFLKSGMELFNLPSLQSLRLCQRCSKRSPLVMTLFLMTLFFTPANFAGIKSLTLDPGFVQGMIDRLVSILHNIRAVIERSMNLTSPSFRERLCSDTRQSSEDSQTWRG